MRVCYFGTYDRDYIRNQVIRQGLEAHNVEVMECHVKLWEDTADKVATVRKGLFSPVLIWRLLSAYTRLLWLYLTISDYDVMIIGYAGHLDVPLGRLLTFLSRKPLVFDAFLSLHDTIVKDRALTTEGSLMGKLALLVDKITCRLPDRVLLDTRAQIRHFCAMLGMDEHRFRCVPVGADETIYHPLQVEQKDGLFRVIYYGKYIPLHGLEYVIQAAKALESHPRIHFEFIGHGQTYEEIRSLADRLRLKNVTWDTAWLDPLELAQRIAKADLCLGIFGTSEKSQRVIPTKVHLALAMEKAVISQDSPAAREILIDGVNAILCPGGDVKSLAKAILALERDRDLCARIAANGHRLFMEKLSTNAVSKEVKRILEELL